MPAHMRRPTHVSCLMWQMLWGHKVLHLLVRTVSTDVFVPAVAVVLLVNIALGFVWNKEELQIPGSPRDGHNIGSWQVSSPAHVLCLHCVRNGVVLWRQAQGNSIENIESCGRGYIGILCFGCFPWIYWWLARDSLYGCMIAPAAMTTSVISGNSYLPKGV